MSGSDIPLARARASALSGAVLLVCACSPIPVDHVYDVAPQICGDPAQFAERLEACRARWESDGSCAGVLGLEGVLDAHELRVAVELERTQVVDIEAAPDERIRASSSSSGTSPFFTFELALRGLGGSLGPLAQPEQWSIVEGDRTLDDASAALELFIEAPGQRSEFFGQAGEIETRVREIDEHALRFTVEFEDGDMLEGCMHALVTETELQGAGDAP